MSSDPNLIQKPPPSNSASQLSHIENAGQQLTQQQQMNIKKQQEYLLKIIQKQVIHLHNKMCGYGVSQNQFIKSLGKSLKSIIRPNRNSSKIKNKDKIISQSNRSSSVHQIFMMIKQYISKRKNKTIRLLFQIINSLDEQINQLSGSSQYQEDKPVLQKKQKNESKARSSLKLEGRRSEYPLDSSIDIIDKLANLRKSISQVCSSNKNSQNQKKDNTNSFKQDDGFVKLEYLHQPDQQVQEIEVKVDSSQKKSRGRPSGRKKKNRS